MSYALFSFWYFFLFSQMDFKLIESFGLFILNVSEGCGKCGAISQDTAFTYFFMFKAMIKTRLLLTAV